MKYDDCSNLDAHLLGDLPPDAVARFTAHLDQCEACREAIDQQQWIDGLLTSPLGCELESPSSTIIQSFCTTINSRRRQTRLIACVFATAAALAVAAGWTALNRQAPAIGAPNGVAVTAVIDDVAHTAPQIGADPPHATFVGGADVLVVPVASRHPNVTIVRVYPTYQPSYNAQANAEYFDSDQFNGG
jgi:hypothetical protein